MAHNSLMIPSKHLRTIQSQNIQLLNISSGFDLKRKPLSLVQIPLLSGLLKHSFLCVNSMSDVYVCKMSQVAGYAMC